MLKREQAKTHVANLMEKKLTDKPIIYSVTKQKLDRSYDKFIEGMPKEVKIFKQLENNVQQQTILSRITKLFKK